MEDGTKVKEFILGLICTEFFKKLIKMKKIINLMIVACGIFAFSCQSNTYEELVPKPETNNNEKVTYAKNIKPIFDASCTTCHKLGGKPQTKPYFDTYDLAKQVTETSELLCRIDGGGACNGDVMPPTGKWPQITIDLVKSWKEQGYIN
jgi:cytochrome c5